MVGGSDKFLSKSPVKSDGGSSFDLGNKTLRPPSLNLRENSHRYLRNLYTGTAKAYQKAETVNEFVLCNAQSFTVCCVNQ